MRKSWRKPGQPKTIRNLTCYGKENGRKQGIRASPKPTLPFAVCWLSGQAKTKSRWTGCLEIPGYSGKSGIRYIMQVEQHMGRRHWIRPLKSQRTYTAAKASQLSLNMRAGITAPEAKVCIL